jgi:serine-type D-Ala-D-Ala carboxypeptidase (penicillin-binding protein 5/6)
MTLITAIISLLLTFHRSLYQPQFAPLPLVRQVEARNSQTITLPVKKLTGTLVPPIQAGAFLVIDQESAEVLVESNADVPLPPASTTKMMTAIVALEKMDIEKVVTVPDEIDGIGSKMYLVPGELIKIKDLIVGLLVHSSNDAAEMIALSYEGGEEAFIRAMNEKADELSMNHTHYENPSGLSSPQHLTTVRDLLVLARYAMKNSDFAEIVKLKQATVKSVDGKTTHTVETTNKLLGEVEGIEGIKTGWTEEAGECLVTQVTRDGHTILTALLRSPDRFTETKLLIAWVFDGFYWETKSVNWN